MNIDEMSKLPIEEIDARLRQHRDRFRALMTPEVYDPAVTPIIEVLQHLILARPSLTPYTAALILMVEAAVPDKDCPCPIPFGLMKLYIMSASVDLSDRAQSSPKN